MSKPLGERARDRYADQMSRQSQFGGASQATLPQGITQKDAGDARGEIHDTFSGVVKAALNKDNYSDLVDHLAKSDRDRLQAGGGDRDRYSDELNQAIDQFRQTWKSKYNDDFSINADQAYSDQFFSFSVGTVTNPQQVSHWPVPFLQQDKTTQRQTSNPSMNQGTDVAVVTFTGMANKPPCHISLDREGTDWKIDVPDTVTADTLKSSLARHISELNSMQGQWPSDANEAQRVVTSHILMGLYNFDKQASGEQGTQSDQSGRSYQSDQPPMGGKTPGSSRY